MEKCLISIEIVTKNERFKTLLLKINGFREAPVPIETILTGPLILALSLWKSEFGTVSPLFIALFMT